MNHHMPLIFEGQERIRAYGQRALLANRWSMQERMVPMPDPGSVEFEDARQIIASIGLEMVSWVIFARPPRNTQVLHSDCAVGPDARARSALNVPVVGGAGSRMEWFTDRPMVMVRSGYGTEASPRTARYYVPEENQKDDPVETAHFTEDPMLVDVYHPHRVVSGKTPRAIVSIRFANNPSFDEIRSAVRQRKPVE
jgi:hypothetical protein